MENLLKFVGTYFFWILIIGVLVYLHFAGKAEFMQCVSDGLVFAICTGWIPAMYMVLD